MFNTSALSLKLASSPERHPVIITKLRCGHTQSHDLSTRCSNRVTVLVTQSEDVWYDASQYHLCTDHGIDFMNLLSWGVTWDWFNPQTDPVPADDSIMVV